jgi:hypothetical protein
VSQRSISNRPGDGREVTVDFEERDGGVLVREVLDAETVHPAERQREGWQAILDRFGRHVEAMR